MVIRSYVIISMLILLGMMSNTLIAQPEIVSINIKGLGNLALNEPVTKYVGLRSVDNKDSLNYLTKRFQIYKISYTYQGEYPLFVASFPIERLAVSSDKNGHIAAIHIILPYSIEVLQYLDKVYGEHRGLRGMVSEDDIRTANQYSMYAWLNGKIFGIISNNMLFHSQQSDHSAKIILSLNNHVKSDYLLFP